MTPAQLFGDLRYAVRLALRQPWLTAAAVVTIALGVGANTAIVSALDTVLLNPLGLRHADRIVAIRVGITKLAMLHAQTSGVEFREAQAMRDIFSSVAALEARAWTTESSGQAARVQGRAVTPDFFQVFGQQPQLGRFFNAEDRESVVLSDGVWRSHFGADRDVIGRAMMLDGAPYRIVGVAPPEFHFPTTAEAWIPLVLDSGRLTKRGNNMNLGLFARLRDGVSAQQASARVAGYVAQLKASADSDAADLTKIGYGIEVDPLAEYIAGDLKRPLLLVWVAGLLVLLIACANVGGLLLTRSAARLKEMAIRLSLGATRSQILRQLLTESLILGLLGGLASLLVALWGVALLGKLPLKGQATLELTKLDDRLLLYGLAVALLCSLLFGLAPAIQLLRQSHAAAMTRSRRHTLQGAFVITEVAGALVLLVTAGLLLRSLWAVQSLRPGFDEHALTTAFLIKPKEAPKFLEASLARLRSMPGVESAALAYPLPFTGGGLTSMFSIRNRQRSGGEPEWHGEAYMVSPEYFETLRIPLLKGRLLAPSDSAAAPLVCLIDAKTADRFFHNQDPIGQEIAMYKGWARIVGVVGAVRATTLEDGSRPIVYYSLRQVPFFPYEGVIVRSATPAVTAIREAIRQTDPGVPLYDVQSMEQRIGESLGIRRVLVWLLAGFAGMTMLLAAIGVHGVVAQLVAERTPEIGIRMALGALPGQILGLFLGRGVRLGATGLAIGLVGVFAAERLLRGMLYEVRAFDPATLCFAVVLVLVGLIFACWWPAWRASRIDPQIALRHE